jgi:HK97 family phage prohead protease
MKKLFGIVSIKSEVLEDRVIRFKGTDETVDRVGDVMTGEGWEVDNYKKNPIFLWAHNYEGLPVGRTVGLSYDEKDKAWMFDVKFATHDEYPFADTVYKLYKGHYLNAVSVGFLPKEVEAGKEKDARKILKKELLELSGCPVPCNPNALQMSFRKAVGDKTVNEQEYLELLESLEKLEKVSEVDLLKQQVEGLEARVKALEDKAIEPEKPAEEKPPETDADLDKQVSEYKGIYSDLLTADKFRESHPKLLSEQEIDEIKKLSEIKGGKDNG